MGRKLISIVLALAVAAAGCGRKKETDEERVDRMLAELPAPASYEPKDEILESADRDFEKPEVYEPKQQEQTPPVKQLPLEPIPKIVHLDKNNLTALSVLEGLLTYSNRDDLEISGDKSQIRVKGRGYSCDFVGASGSEKEITLKWHEPGDKTAYFGVLVCFEQFNTDSAKHAVEFKRCMDEQKIEYEAYKGRISIKKLEEAVKKMEEENEIARKFLAIPKFKAYLGPFMEDFEKHHRYDEEFVANTKKLLETWDAEKYGTELFSIFHVFTETAQGEFAKKMQEVYGEDKLKFKETDRGTHTYLDESNHQVTFSDFGFGGESRKNNRTGARHKIITAEEVKSFLDKQGIKYEATVEFIREGLDTVTVTIPLN